jgi:hypothetical protein
MKHNLLFSSKFVCEQGGKETCFKKNKYSKFDKIKFIVSALEVAPDGTSFLFL